MIDGHIHIERGDYTVEWIQQFVDKAVEMKLDEIWLLEHCYRFAEFLPMYDAVCAYSDYINKWFHRKAGVLNLDDFLMLADSIRGRSIQLLFETKWFIIISLKYRGAQQSFKFTECMILQGGQ